MSAIPGQLQGPVGHPVIDSTPDLGKGSGYYGPPNMAKVRARDEEYEGKREGKEGREGREEERCQLPSVSSFRSTVHQSPSSSTLLTPHLPPLLPNAGGDLPHAHLDRIHSDREYQPKHGLPEPLPPEVQPLQGEGEGGIEREAQEAGQAVCANFALCFCSRPPPTRTRLGAGPLQPPSSSSSPRPCSHRSTTVSPARVPPPAGPETPSMQ